MEESVARPVLVSERGPERNVSEELHCIVDAELDGSPFNGVRERAVPGKHEPPTRVSLAETSKHSGEKEWVLLGLETADVQNTHVTLPRPLESLVGWDDFGFPDEREAGHEVRRAAARVFPA